MAKKTNPVAVLTDEQPIRALRSSATFRLKPADMETPTGISMTVPNMAMDLRLMLHREQSGIPIARKNGQFYDDELPPVYKMSEIELIEYRLENAQQIEQLLQEQHDAAKALEKYHTDRENAIKDQQNTPAPAASA